MGKTVGCEGINKRAELRQADQSTGTVGEPDMIVTDKASGRI